MKSDNTLEGTMLTTSIMNTQGKGGRFLGDQRHGRCNKTNSSRVKRDNAEHTMEESQAEISKERAEENIVTEAEKDNNSKLPMVADAGKDNWESHQEDQIQPIS